MDRLNNCRLCPRRCGVDRNLSTGVCGAGSDIVVSKVMLHSWEEPCISVGNGAGTIFFSGCSLHCCYCQNNSISRHINGRVVTVPELADIFLKLQDCGADNIELVTPTHYVLQIIKALDIVKSKLEIPVVYNTSGYELLDTIKILDGYVDIFLPDLKYISPDVGKRYSNAYDYFEYASEAIKQMVNQVGPLSYDDRGALMNGTIIRHLILPSLRHESIKILDWISANFSSSDVIVSLMSQYTPFDFISDNYPELKRRVTKMEYNSVINHAAELGISGFMQEKSSASANFLPDFNNNDFITDIKKTERN